MSFSFFRKHQKLLLYAAAVFTVAVFAFFPSMGDMDQLFREDATGGPNDVLGSFTVQTTGETREVTYREFFAIRQSLGRFTGGAPEEAIWQHLMLVADAQGAGLGVSDVELFRTLKAQVFGGQAMTAERYRSLWDDALQFGSAKAFEDFFKELILAQRWREALEDQARIVDSDEVYARWKIDNELFDLDVVVFPHVAADSIADPGDEVLQAYYDEMPEFLRNRRFVDPARYDLVYAWLPLDADVSALPADKLEEIADKVTDGAVQLRFDQQKAERFPEQDEPDEATLALLRDEVTVIELVAAAHRAWVASLEEELEGPLPETGGPGSAEAFAAHAEAYGLRVEDPTGELDPEGLEALEHIGSPNLTAQLFNVEAGDSRFYRPFGDTAEAHILFVESVTVERPLAFDEARDQVLDSWRAEPDQVAAAAQAFRASLREQARLVEEAAEIIAPLEQAAADAAEARIAAALEADGEELDEAALQAIRDEELEAVQADIEVRLADFEHRAWDELVAQALADGSAGERLSYDGVSKAYRSQVSGDVDRTTLEYFVKTNAGVFQLGEDGITDVLRHATGEQSVVVRVAARRFPVKADMFADAEGMQRARDRLAAVRAVEFQAGWTPDRLQAPASPSNPYGHGLRVVQATEEAAGTDSGTTDAGE